MVARRPPEKSELFLLLGAPQVTQRSVGCSAPSSLPDPILDCPVFSGLFDAILYHSALLDTPLPCCSDRHTLDQLVLSWIFIVFLCADLSPADRRPDDDSAH